MNISNLKIGQVIKNYKELCSLLGEKVKTGDSKKYQLIDFSRYFKWEKEGNKFIITEISEVPEVKKGRGGNNVLPFIDEMELLIIDLLMKSKKELIISNSKLLLELCMVNPNYYDFFNNKESLAEILEMDIAYIIDYYDSTNSTFKSAINTVMKRLENKKLIIHEKIMMVQFIDTEIQTTPTGHARVSDIYYYDNDSDKYINKNIQPKETFRRATEYEREIILKVEKDILENKYHVNDVQQLFRNGNINNYYIDVSKELYNTLNIKKAYKANRITIHEEGIKNELLRLLNEWELFDTQFMINNKVMNRINEGVENRHKKSLTSSKNNEKYSIRKNDHYIHNNFELTNNLISKDKKKLEKKKPNSINKEIDQYILDSLPDDM